MLHEALDGRDDKALTEIVDRLLPIVQTRVARALLERRGLSRGRDVRQDTEDLTQEVFAALFRRGARALRAWDPDRGLSLENFVGLLAEREVSTIFASRRRSPWTEEPTAHEALDRACGVDDRLAREVSSRDLLSAMTSAAEAELSEKGANLFELLYMEQRSVREVAEQTGMTVAALYAWRSRLVRFFRHLRDELSGPSARGLEG